MFGSLDGGAGFTTLLADRYDKDTFKDSGFKEWLNALSESEKESMTAASALESYKTHVASTNNQVSTAATVTSKLTSGLKGIAGTIGSSLLNFGASMAVMAAITLKGKRNVRNWI